MDWINTLSISPTLRQKLISFLLTDLSENILMLLTLFRKTSVEGRWLINGGEEHNHVVGALLEICHNEQKVINVSGNIPLEKVWNTISDQVIVNFVVNKRSKKKYASILSSLSSSSVIKNDDLVF